MTTRRIAALLIPSTVLIVAVCIGFAWLFGGCAASNLTGAAKVHQSVTLAIADGCTVAVQAEHLYEAGTIPQTDQARHAINAAGEACNQAKTAFTLALRAEQQYNNAQSRQIVACTPVSGGTVDKDACSAAIESTTKQQVAANAANTDLSNKLSVLATKAGDVKPLTAAAH